MERFHHGIGEKGFFQKDVSKGFPEWLQRVEVQKKGGTVHHPIVTDTRSLVWLANQSLPPRCARERSQESCSSTRQTKVSHRARSGRLQRGAGIRGTAFICGQCSE
jgi:hypothetical protein